MMVREQLVYGKPAFRVRTTSQDASAPDFPATPPEGGLVCYIVSVQNTVKKRPRILPFVPQSGIRVNSAQHERPYKVNCTRYAHPEHIRQAQCSTCRRIAHKYLLNRNYIPVTMNSIITLSVPPAGDGDQTTERGGVPGIIPL